MVVEIKAGGSRVFVAITVGAGVEVGLGVTEITGLFKKADGKDTDIPWLRGVN